MKAKLLIFLLIFGMLTISSGTVFAIGGNGNGCYTSITMQDTNGNATDITWQASQNVTLCANVVVQSYAASTKHLNGNRTFGGASNSSVIYWQSSNEGTAISAAPSAADSSAFSGWNSL